jgi:hypothetical protein
VALADPVVEVRFKRATGRTGDHDVVADDIVGLGLLNIDAHDDPPALLWECFPWLKTTATAVVSPLPKRRLRIHHHTDGGVIITRDSTVVNALKCSNFTVDVARICHEETYSRVLPRDTINASTHTLKGQAMTLRHIVSWKLNGETFAARNGQAAKIAEALAALPDRIPEIRELNVYRNELYDGKNFDLTLIADFDDAEGLATYANHPEHLPVLDMIKGMISDRVAVDFTV